jgi:hypothetical protein
MMKGPHWRRRGLAVFLLPILVLGMTDVLVDAQTPRKSKAQKARPAHPRAQPKSKSMVETRPRREHPQRSYVRTRRDYGHVRLTRRERHEGRLNVRPIIVKSARVSPVVLQRFEDRRRDQLQLVIQHYREGRRTEGLETWTGFVNGLADYPEPVDLDDVMLYVARESCLHGDGSFIFHAGRVEFLNESAAQWGQYVAQLEEQLDDCRRGRRACSAETRRNLESELTRRKAEWEVFDIQARVADKEFDRVLRESRDYEGRFAATFEDMYHEVEVRIQYSP